MAGTLRDIREIETEIEAAGLRGISKRQLLDLIRSVSKTAGVMSIANGTPENQSITIAPGWNRIDVWALQRSTQGVASGLGAAEDPGGWWLIRRPAAGAYNISAAIHAIVDTAGKYELRVASVDAAGVVSTTPYRDAVTIAEPGEISLVIAAALLPNVEQNEKIQLEIRGPNGSVAVIESGQFGVWR